MLKKTVLIMFLILLTACDIEANDEASILNNSVNIKPSEKIFWGIEGNVLYISAVETEHSVKENTTVLNSKKISDIPWYLYDGKKYSYTIENVIIENSDVLIAPISMKCWFSNMNDLKLIEGLDNIDTSLVTDMSYLFDECHELTSLDLRKFNTINVKDMSYMFSSCCGLKQLDLSSFDTSNVMDMEGMFSFLYTNKMDILDLTSFDTSNVTNMRLMFYRSIINSLNITSFDTTNVKIMDNMFKGFETDKLDLSNFNTSNVEDMSFMFDSVYINELDLSSFNTSNVEDMSFMFNWARIKLLDISSFDTSNVKRIRGMFGSPDEHMRSIDVSNFDLSHVEDITSIDDLFIDTNPF